MYRALGLVMTAAAGFVIGSDQSLQVASGRVPFPLRVRNTTPLLSPRQEIRPQRATALESCTGDSNHPAEAPPFSRRSSFPKFPVVASRPRGDGTNRVASPSFVWATSVTLPPSARWLTR